MEIYDKSPFRQHELIGKLIRGKLPKGECQPGLMKEKEHIPKGRSKSGHKEKTALKLWASM